MSRITGRVLEAGFIDGVWYILFATKAEAIKYCEIHQMDPNIDKLDNGLWRLETDLYRKKNSPSI